MYDVEDRPYLIARAENMALNALKEIPQYRAIGTVEDIKEVMALCKSLQETVCKYMDVGTIEECRFAAERMKPRKPILGRFGVIRCISCDEKVGQMVTKTLKEDCMNFCGNCGSKVDWSE